MKKKLIIFGASGTIGSALIELLHTDGGHEVYGTYYKTPVNLPPEKSIKLSIDDLDKLDQLMNKVKPDLVFLALRGDFDKQFNFHVEVAEHLKRSGGQMIFCSTANVFDGDVKACHYEADEPNAVSEYGKYKVKCEKQIRSILNDNLTIIRIPEVFGQNTPRILALKEKLENNEEIVIYPNFFVNRNSDIFLAMQVNYIMNQRLTGIFHLGTTDVMSHSLFIRSLVKGWGYKHVKFREEMFPEDTYFAVLPKNEVLPTHLRINSSALLEYLISCK